MRKIEIQMNAAISNRESWTSGNTAVVYECALDEPMRARIEQARVFLHGNHIGTYIYKIGRFDLNPRTLALWPTRTTKSRLRALGATV